MRGLYAIIDPEHCRGRDPRWVAEEVLAGGCAALQLRAKALLDRELLSLARALATRCAARGVPFWLNDRIDLALLADAHGVHLGQDDVPLADARTLVGGRALGLSTHSLAQAQAASAAGADLIGFGPIFATTSKLRPDPCVGTEGLRDVVQNVSCPVVAIGGITLAHAAEIARTGASYAAAIGAICGAERPGAAANALHAALIAGGRA